MPQTMVQSATQLFTDNWKIYQKIINQNYMLHREFAAKGNTAFKKLKSLEPFKVLDLGCGDAQLISEQLSVFEIDSYIGYDLSATALALASKNLESNNITYELCQGAMEMLLDTTTSSFDIIHSSFAIHHLGDSGKKTFLKKCFQKLSPGGLFIIIDVFRDAVSLETYKRDYISRIRSHWNYLPDNEKDMIIDHILRYDYPADISIFKLWAKEAGFTVTTATVKDSFHKMLLLSKAVN